jgi:hypothetical protein
MRRTCSSKKRDTLSKSSNVGRIGGPWLAIARYSSFGYTTRMKIHHVICFLSAMLACGGAETAPASPVATTPPPAVEPARVDNPPSVAKTAEVAVAPTAVPTASAVAPPAAPALPAPGTNMVAQRPFTPKSAFFAKREHFGAKKDLVVIFGVDGMTCEHAKSAKVDDELLKKDGSRARFAFEASWKDGTVKIAGAETDPGKSIGGLAIFSFPKTAALSDKNGSWGLYGTMTLANTKGDTAQITVEVGDKADGVAKSAEYYLKTSMPITRCK